MSVFKTGLWVLLLAWMLVSCNQVAEEKDRLLMSLRPEVKKAIQSHTVVNEMTQEEVQLSLGEPHFVEVQSATAEKWIYRSPSGIEVKEAYPIDSSFPQGVGFVIPLQYKANEIRIDFNEKRVCRIEKILRF